MSNENIPASSGATEIFRMPSADATVPDIMAAAQPVLNDMTVSRHHANLDLSHVALGYASIKDLGSLNGTWVDGAIVNEANLKDGSTIQIGTFRMVFHTNSRKARIATDL